NGLIIYGRSDATLNPGGVRIGTSEIYRLVEQNEEILESLVVGVRKKGDEEIILFVKLKDDKPLEKHLKEKIRTQLKNQASPRHVPKHIFSVPEIPRTISGKIVELTVRNILEGQVVK